jgi:acyl-CoA dehydrogenase
MHFKPPSDKLGHKVAELLLTPSQSRDRLTAGVFIPMNEADTVARLEDALVKTIKAEHIERKLRQKMKSYQPGYQVMDTMLSSALSQGIINDEEADLLREAETARWHVIQVDDFSNNMAKE